MGPVLGPHVHTNRAREPRVAEPWLPAPRDGRSGEGQRLTPDALHTSGRQAPQGRPSATPAARSPPQNVKAKGTVLDPTPAHLRPQHVSSGPRQPALTTGSRGRESA